MSPYKDIKLINYPPLSTAVSVARKKILDDISPKEKHLVCWYQEEKWLKNNFTFSTIAKDSQGNLVALSSCKKMADKTLKILCHHYVMRKMRHIYRSISHTDFVPHCVEYAKAHKLKGVWFSIHCFNRRQICHKESTIRSLNGGRVDLKFQPYISLFRYMGEVNYNNVIQSQFFYPIKTEKDIRKNSIKTGLIGESKSYTDRV